MILVTKGCRIAINIRSFAFVVAGIFSSGALDLVGSENSSFSPPHSRPTREHNGGGGAGTRCPVRIISTRVHQPTSAESDPPIQPEFGEFEGEALPNYGDNIHPWPHNNSGMLSSNQFSPPASALEHFPSGTNFKCQFIFLGAADEHVQLIFHRFKLFTEKGVWQNLSNLRYGPG